MWINIQNSSGVRNNLFGRWIRQSFEQRGEFQIVELTGMELCLYEEHWYKKYFQYFFV